jgi:hypothetical protein
VGDDCGKPHRGAAAPVRLGGIAPAPLN